jgi:hypothetical protein
MPDNLWPEGESQESPFAQIFDPVAPDEGLTAGFGLFRETDAGHWGGENQTCRIVRFTMLPSFPGVPPEEFLRACAPEEWEKLKRQLGRPTPATGVSPMVVGVLGDLGLTSAREKEILDLLGLTVEQAWARCEAMVLA